MNVLRKHADLFLFFNKCVHLQGFRHRHHHENGPHHVGTGRDMEDESMWHVPRGGGGRLCEKDPQAESGGECGKEPPKEKTAEGNMGAAGTRLGTASKRAVDMSVQATAEFAYWDKMPENTDPPHGISTNFGRK